MCSAWVKISASASILSVRTARNEAADLEQEGDGPIFKVNYVFVMISCELAHIESFFNCIRSGWFTRAFFERFRRFHEANTRQHHVQEKLSSLEA